MRRTLSILATVALAGCSTPPIRERLVEVKLPVAIHAIKPEQVPEVPTPLGLRPESLSAAADTLLAAHCRFVAYALKADPLLRIASGQSPRSLPAFPECGEQPHVDPNR